MYLDPKRDQMKGDFFKGVSRRPTMNAHTLSSNIPRTDVQNTITNSSIGDNDRENSVVSDGVDLDLPIHLPSLIEHTNNICHMDKTIRNYKPDQLMGNVGTRDFAFSNSRTKSSSLWSIGIKKGVLRV